MVSVSNPRRVYYCCPWTTAVSKCPGSLLVTAAQILSLGVRMTRKLLSPWDQPHLEIVWPNDGHQIAVVLLRMMVAYRQYEAWPQGGFAAGENRWKEWVETPIQ